MKRKFFLHVWNVIALFEKSYWFFWKENQLNQFKACGTNVTISRHCHFTNSSITLGNKVYVGQGCRFQASKSEIIIGNNVMFGPNVSIHGGNHRHDIVGRYMIDITLEEKLPKNDEDVIIKDDVWIGDNAIILKGVTIGEGAIVGAGSIINDNVEAYSIVVGNKPRKIFARFNDREIKTHRKLLSLK